MERFGSSNKNGGVFMAWLKLGRFDDDDDDEGDFDGDDDDEY